MPSGNNPSLVYPLPHTIIPPGARHRYTPLCLCLVSLVSWFYMPLVNVSPSINLICSWQLSGPRKPPTFSNVNFCLLCDMKLVFLRQQFGKYHLEWEELLFDEVLFAPMQLEYRVPLQLSFGPGFVQSISLDSMTTPSSFIAAV